MAAYNGSHAYDLSLFEPREQSTVSVSSAAPQRRPQQVPQKPHLVKPKPKSRQQLKIEARQARIQTFKILCMSLFFMMCIGALIFSRIQLDEISREISATQADIEVAKSENVRLTMELNSKVSLDKVEAYAVEVLGMVKRESYQTEYVDLSGGDQIIVSGGKTASNQKETSKIRELLAYIF